MRLFYGRKVNDMCGVSLGLNVDSHSSERVVCDLGTNNWTCDSMNLEHGGDTLIGSEESRIFFFNSAHVYAIMSKTGASLSAGKERYFLLSVMIICL